MTRHYGISSLFHIRTSFVHMTYQFAHQQAVSWAVNGFSLENYKRYLNSVFFISIHTPYSIKIQRDFLINSKIKNLAIDASRQFSLMVNMRNLGIFSYHLACISQENKNIKKSLCVFLKAYQGNMHTKFYWNPPSSYWEKFVPMLENGWNWPF